MIAILNGGEGGIRTPGTFARTPHFECGAIDHSATSPHAGVTSRSRALDSEAGALCQPLFVTVDLKAGPDTTRPIHQRQVMGPNFASVVLERAATAERGGTPVLVKLTKTTKTA
jgi:hypothetical protein